MLRSETTFTSEKSTGVENARPTVLQNCVTPVHLTYYILSKNFLIIVANLGALHKTTLKRPTITWNDQQ